jgi:hypothetical protein
MPSPTKLPSNETAIRPLAQVFRAESGARAIPEKV